MGDIFGFGELRSPVFWRDVVVEVVASALLLLCLTCNMVEYQQSFTVTPTHAGLVMGFIVCAIVETFGHMGGAHINPAVTFTLACRRDISPVKGVFYTIAQCAGGITGSAIVYGFTAPGYRNMFNPFQPAEELGPVRGMFIEAILTFTLCTVIQGVTDSTKATPCGLPGAPIGFTVAVNIMVGMTYTGAAFNPIIALGPAVISRNFRYNWIYWAGPYLGALVSIVMYGVLRWIGKKYSVKPTKHSIGTVDEMLQLLREVQDQKQNNNIEKLSSL